MVGCLFIAPHAHAAVLLAGPGKPFPSPCSAVAAARPGDIIEVDSSGAWVDDFCTISTSGLTLRSAGTGRARVTASGAVALGPHQAIWAIEAPGVTLEGFEISGATSGKPPHRAAGIRVLPGVGVTIRDSVLHDNDVGLWVAGGPPAEVVIERSEFSANGRIAPAIDIGPVARFTMTATYAHHGREGALVSTRAEENHLLYNRITRENGTGASEIDLKDAGRTYLIGNLLQHQAESRGAAMVAYGRERTVPGPSSELYVVNNTFVNEGAAAAFLQVAAARSVRITNNIFFGNGTVDAPGAVMAQNFAGDPEFVDKEGFDYRLRPGSPAINAGTDPGIGSGYPLTPLRHYLHPMAEEGRVSQSVIDIGAYEYGGSTGRWEPSPLAPVRAKPQEPTAAPRAPLAGDGVTLALASGTVVAGGSVVLNLSLTSVGPQPSGLQWTFTYPAGDVTSMQVAAGAAATAALKTVSCGTAAGSMTCILFGMNTTAIGDGVVATLTLQAASSSAGAIVVGVANAIATSGAGTSIAASATGGTATVQSAQTPVPSSVSPASGSGLTQTFTAVYNDGNGAADIAGAYVLVNSQIRADLGCFVLYHATANTVQLLDNSGQWWSAPVPVGTGSLSNSQCTVNVAAVTTSASGATLTVNLPLTFTTAFAGNRNVYLLAVDRNGLNSNWSSKGTWTVPLGPQPPATGTVSPASGSGYSQTFTATYTDANGATDIAGAYFLVNSQARADLGCFVYYSRAANTVQLLNDAGTVWSAAMAPGGGGLANSQCTLSGAGLSAGASGNTLTVTLPVTFTAAFAGTRNIYLLAIDSGGSNTNWSLKGAWTVPAPNQPPAPNSISPNSGSGVSQTFAAVYTDANGATDIAGGYLLVHSQVRADAGCFVYYNRAANTVQLLNDQGTLWSSPLTVGSGSLANSYCTVTGSGVSAVASGNTLTVHFPLSFTPAFGGSRNLYLLAVDTGGANSNWYTLGAWTVPLGPLPATPQTVSPASGSGYSQTFTATYSDPNGGADITGAYFLFHSQVQAGAGCFVYFNPAANTVQLLNDAGTAWSAPITAGSGTLANSQCTISGVGVGGSVSGNTLTVAFPVIFSPAFSGARNVYLLAIDSTGNNSNWRSLGTWIVQ